MAQSLLIKSDAKIGKPYQFKTGKRFKRTKPEITGKIIEFPKKLESTDPPIGLIDGREPDSILEWRLYLGFVRAKIPYRYQVPVMGGKERRGGLVIDFVAMVAPLPRPVFAHGDYWHSEFKNPLYEQMTLSRMNSQYKGQFGEPVVIWEHEIPDAYSAYRILVEELIHGRY